MAGTREPNAEAVKDAFALYIKYNGDENRFDQIEQDMHRLGWSWFKKQQLKDKGRGEHHRDGWITKFGWANALKLHVAASQSVAATSAESLLAEAEFIRKDLFIEIKAAGVGRSKDLIWQHQNYSKACTDILAKLNDARDNYGNFLFFLQHLVKAAPGISPALAKEIVEAEDALIEWAENEFVVEEERPEE